jgi:hypothetical protein
MEAVMESESLPNKPYLYRSTILSTMLIEYLRQNLGDAGNKL